MPPLVLQMLLLLLPGQQQYQEEKVYTVSEVNVKPEPLKGIRHFQDRWMSKVKYPEKAVRERIQGTVFIEFIVNTDGSIAEAAVRSGIGHGCDEAALKGFLEVAREGWKPGMKDNRPVKVKMVQPFFFRIIEG
jgi:protein TonB